MTMKFGVQGSTWILDYDTEADKMDEIISDVNNAKLEGVDVQVALLGKYKHKPALLKDELKKKNLQLAALTLPHSFPEGKPSQEEKDLEIFYLEFLKHFPGAILNVPSRVEKNRNQLLQRQKEIIKGANELGKFALEEYGITTSFHPISYPTSYWRFKEDYDVLFDGLNPEFMGYTPDAGHILFGGMNPVDVINEAFPLIKHVHFKDATRKNEWKKIGEGDIDFKECINILKDGGYNKWIILEEETGSTQETRKVVSNLGEFAKTKLKPIVQ